MLFAAPMRTRESGGFPALTAMTTPIKASRQDDFDSDSGDEAAKNPKFKFVIKNSSQIAASAAAASSVAPIVLAPTPALTEGVHSRSRDRRAAAEESSQQSASFEASAADLSPMSKRKSVHNPAIDAQIKQYSKAQGISAAHVDIDEGLVDVNTFRELEAQLIELKLSWALVRQSQCSVSAVFMVFEPCRIFQVNAENDNLRKSCRDLRRELEQANM
jgi:hypothetical protein